MAFYILILKESEEQNLVIYRYGSHEDRMGRFALDKLSGDCEQIDPTPDASDQHLFVRAAVKVRQLWQNNQFPERTIWAS